MKRRVAAGVALTLLMGVAARAEEKSVSPYIDEIRKELREEDAEKGQSTESYTEKLKRQLKKQDEERARELGDPAPGSKTYIQQLEEEDPSLKNKPKPDGYIDSIKGKLEPQKQGGAIDAVMRGQSELEARKRGEITGAFGFKMGVTSNRNITAGDAQAREFDQVYEGFAPEVQFYYEWQPWHSEFWGNVGLVGAVGISYFNGFGKFAFEVPKGCQTAPCSAGNFPIDSETRFQFVEFPVMVAIDYRFNLLKYIRPFIMAGPMAIPFFEARDDDRDTLKGISKAFVITGGVSFLLDWISASSSWDLYSDHGIHHMYLTLDYTKITTIASTVSFDTSMVSAGIAFEF